MPTRRADRRGKTPQRAEVMVPARVLLEMARNVVQFPFATICVHSVAADLLSVLEQHGLPPDADFKAAAKHVVNAHDVEAVAALDRMIAKQAAP